jgi:hypothetical protein
MNIQQFEKAKELLKKIEEKKISVKKLEYALLENIVERTFILDFSGYDGIAEFDKKDFKKVCGVLLPILKDDLLKLETEFETL